MNKILLTRNAKIDISSKGNEKFSLTIPYGARIYFDNNQKVNAKQLLADWDPYTIPIIAEKEGFVKYVDLKQGQTYKEMFDDTTGIASKVISDWSQGLKTKDLKPSINLVNSKGIVEKLENGNDVNYPMSIDTILSVDDGDSVKSGQVIARLPKETSKTKDITGGLPRVADLFEASLAYEAMILNEQDDFINASELYQDNMMCYNLIVDPLEDSDSRVNRFKLAQKKVSNEWLGRSKRTSFNLSKKMMLSESDLRDRDTGNWHDEL